MRRLVMLLVLLFLLQGYEAESKAVAITREDFTKNCKYTPPPKFNQMVYDAGKEFKINPRVIALTAFRESGCDSKAIGSQGEIGLMQINPSVWGVLLRKKGFDIRKSRDNIRAGAFILSSLAIRSKSIKETLRRYNGSGKKAEQYASDQLKLYHKLWKANLKNIL